MGQRYTSAVRVRCVKEHTCVACGCVYAYHFTRDLSAAAGSAEKAAAAVKRKAAEALTAGVDLEPCPSCGLYQPDMAARQQLSWHATLFGAAVVALPVLLILGAAYLFHLHELVWAGTAFCALAAYISLRAGLRNHNRDAGKNLRLAEGRVYAGTLHVLSEGRPGPPGREWTHPPRSPAHGIAMILLPLALLATASPELLRLARQWGLNDTWPAVVGPGDSPTVYMDGTVSCVESKWCGWPSVVLRHADALGNAEGPKVDVPAKSQDIMFRSAIELNGSGRNSQSRPWVQPTIPDDPALAGRRMRCEINMRVEYAVVTAPQQYEVQNTTLVKDVPLALGSPGAGRLYTRLWWLGTTAGGLLPAVYALLMIASAYALARRAIPPVARNVVGGADPDTRLLGLGPAAGLVSPEPPAAAPTVAPTSPLVSPPPAAAGATPGDRGARRRRGIGVPLAAALILGAGVAFAIFHFGNRGPEDPGEDTARPIPGFTRASHYVVYVVNSGAAMRDRIGDAKAELHKALDGLGPNQQFDIVVCGGPKLRLFSDLLTSASPDAVREAHKFVDGIVAEGPGDLLSGAQTGMKLGADVMWVADTGHNGAEVVDGIRRSNEPTRIRINTVTAFAASSAPPGPAAAKDFDDVHELWRIAHTNGGVCVGNDGKPIPEPKTPPPLPFRETPGGRSIFHE